ncbi:MAG: DUF4391 domain-containing protein [Oscillospiraceae bacterium]|nr:DUF4391 domain-containing protein [Oscillospiraceae bacterium]
MYEKLNIPAACGVDKPIYKKMFYDNADLSRADKALFTDVIDKVTWVYCLKPESIPIKPYRDETRDYPEVEVLEVALTAEKGLRRIAEIIMRAIPYPMLLIFRLGEQAQVWAAHQRFNLSDSEKVTLEEFVSTDWLTDDSPLWAALDAQKQRFTNFFDFYTDWVDAISIYHAQCTIHNCGSVTGAEARNLLAEQAQREAKIAALRAEMKKETQFNRKVELNMEIKRLGEEGKIK